jgi:hypothetical protein
MTTDRDDASLRRYREANAALDERPSAATRAAILAAAARQVEAKPQPAEAPRVTRRRWPLAAAAAVLLSTLAVMMAQRTEQEMPTFTAPAEQLPAKVAAAPAGSPPAAEQVTQESQASRPAAPASDSAPQASSKNDVPAETAARRKEAAGTRAAGAPAMADSRVTESKTPAPAIPADAPATRAEPVREREAASAERSAFPAAPAAAPPAPAVEKPSAALGAAGSANNEARPDASPAYRAARKELAPAPSAAPAAQGVVRSEAQRDAELSAPDWLERIVKLRGEGRHAEADAELKRFRERYPDVRVPPAALSPPSPASGTR